jgi:L-aminopeptidase/D-esterase-like protein
MNKAAATKLASVGHDGIARAVRPAHSVFDGDTLFAMAHGNIIADFDAISILAVHAIEKAIINAVKQAKTMAGYLAYTDINKEQGQQV